MKQIKNKLKIIAAGMSLVTVMSACSANKDNNNNQLTTESLSITTETTTEQTTTSESEVVETSESNFTVETESYTNPFGDYVYDEGYASVAANVAFTGDYQDFGLYYGFDNPYVIDALRKKIQECTGETNTEATLSDVGYFQYSPYVMETYGRNNNFNDLFAPAPTKYISVEAVRAVLSSLGLRFGIDEIPASYLMERFPRFYYDQFNGTDCFQFQDTVEITGDYDINNMDSINEVTDSNALDVIIFTSCIYYNKYRIYCMYGHPYEGSYTGFVQQVREASSGKNVLVPTPEQAEVMQSDINSFPNCEDVDIFAVQTVDDFYSVYGYYPNEILDLRNSVNTPENFEAYSNGYSFQKSL